MKWSNSELPGFFMYCYIFESNKNTRIYMRWAHKSAGFYHNLDLPCSDHEDNQARSGCSSKHQRMHL